MRDLARPVAAGVAAALVPPRCAGCDAPGAWLCLECRAALEPADVPLAGLPVRVAGLYEGPLRAAIHRYKYRAEPGLAAELGDLVADLLARDLARGSGVDVVVPVPLHPRRVRERGYDQTALLAERIALRTGMPLRRALRRVRHVRPQVELDRSERLRNVAGAFAGAVGSLRGARVALVDDVVTTGATLREAARAAHGCGARRVRAYAVAHDE
ncbi:MAG: ComF family protein [Chloroflexota bacterium]|nr:ComF family protein [Chloroflexota bacterium]